MNLEKLVELGQLEEDSHKSFQSKEELKSLTIAMLFVKANIWKFEKCPLISISLGKTKLLNK